MRERLASESGKALYQVRRQVVEPVIGQIKQARGIRRFSFRGLGQGDGRMEADLRHAQYASDRFGGIYTPFAEFDSKVGSSN